MDGLGRLERLLAENAAHPGQWTWQPLAREAIRVAPELIQVARMAEKYRCCNRESTGGACVHSYLGHGTEPVATCAILLDQALAALARKLDGSPEV